MSVPRIGQYRVLKLGTIVSLGAILIGCGTDTRDTRSKTQNFGQSACSHDAPCEASFQFPSGILAENLAISAKEGIHIGSGTDLSDADGEPAGIASEGGEIHIQASSTVGTVRTADHVFVGGGSTISGDLFSGSLEAQAGSIVPERQDPTGDPGVATWSVTFPAARGPNVNLEPGLEQSLAPGAHGTLRIASRSKLKLSTGTYYFDSLQLEPDAVLELDTTGGTIVINVLGDFTHRGKLTSLGDPSDVLVTSFSTGRVELGNEFDGTLVAPYAEVSIARAQTGDHDGQFFAKKVSLQGGVVINATPASATGPAIDDLDADFTPGSGVPLPVPAPVLTDQTLEEWNQEQADFLTALIESGYMGEPVLLDVHPDAATVQSEDDYVLPENATVNAAPSPEIPGRTISVPPGFWQGEEPLNQMRDDEPGEDAAVLFEQEIEETQDEIAEDDRFSYIDMPDSVADPAVEYGTEPEILDVPETCVLSRQAVIEPPAPPTEFDGKPIDAFSEFVLQDVVDPVVLGNKPDYLVRNHLGQNNFNKDAAPQFDGYWFFESGIRAGWNGVGMEGSMDAGMYAGIVAFKNHAELLRFYLEATGAIAKQTEVDGETQTGPYFAAKLETEIVGKKSLFGNDLPNWEAVNDVERAKFKTNLVNATVLVFDDSEGRPAPRIQIGPFAVVFNGGAQVKIPLSLDLDRFGPEVTLAPMFRIFVTIFAGIDVYIAKLGITGEADMIRVDMPFKAKLKWRDYVSPETCYSSADFDVTFQSIWSTLNGNIKVSVSGRVPIIGEVKIADQQIVKWTGLEFASPEVSLIPTLSLPLFDLPANKCALGAGSCVFGADAHQVGALPEFWEVQVPYTNPECDNQYVFEVDMEDRDLDEIWIRRRWSFEDTNTPAVCEDSMVQVFVYRQMSNGQWETTQNDAGETVAAAFDQYTVFGEWNDSTNACETQAIGKSGPDTTNTTNGFPFSWVDTQGVQKVRVVVAGGSDCAQRGLALGVTADP